jgi:Antimicrobial peptide resistance and lipid A acylation protein PagP
MNAVRLGSWLIIVCLSLLSSEADASDWSIVVNGRSIHLGATEQWNESNWGLGFEREFDGQSHWVKLALGNGFKDSQNAMSYMAGGGIKRRFRPRAAANDFYVDVGVIAFMMTREDVNHNDPFPGMLPALTIGTTNVAVNVTYLSGSIGERITNGRLIDPSIDGVLFFQLKLDARLFGIGARSSYQER